MIDEFRQAWSIWLNICGSKAAVWGCPIRSWKLKRVVAHPADSLESVRERTSKGRPAWSHHPRLCDSCGPAVQKCFGALSSWVKNMGRFIFMSLNCRVKGMFGKKEVFLEFWLPHPQNQDTLSAVELKDPRPASPNNSAIEEKPSLHGHTTSGHGNGTDGKKLGWKEKWMDSRLLDSSLIT